MVRDTLETANTSMQHTLIIAEAGVNHNGDLAMARQLVEVAVASGADAVKFQTFRADCLASPNAPKAAYQLRMISGTVSQHEMIRALELDEPSHRLLASQCSDLGIEFLSTPFDVDSLRLLRELGLTRFKVPSGEVTNLPLLRAIGDCGAPVILSTGMASLGEVEAALEVIESRGVPRDLITVLQCTTEYPAPAADVNLRAMTNMGQAFGVRYGLSDHTMGWEIAVAAVAMGACVIEKHFTLDRALPGPDHQASLEPQELAAMVRAIRNVELAMGDGIKRVAPSEAGNIHVTRRSLVAACSIKKGERFTPENVAAKRPGGGMSPMRWDAVIGQMAPRDFVTDDAIELA
jgi:N,N'-diacetyllegionaminate synthase